MGALNYTAGKREYTLPGGGVIWFDPCDSEFANRVILAVRNCQEIQKRFPQNGFADLDEQLACIQNINDDIRREIDNAFGDQVADKACCGSSPTSISDGLPVWMNFLMAVIDEIALDISKQVYNSMDEEVSSKEIGEMVMERLKKVDEIAYVRYASVYRSFKDLSSFMSELKQMMKAERAERKKNEKD